MDICHSQQIYLKNKDKKILDTATRTGLYSLKAASKKIVHKTAEVTVQLIANNIAD